MDGSGGFGEDYLVGLAIVVGGSGVFRGGDGEGYTNGPVGLESFDAFEGILGVDVDGGVFFEPLVWVDGKG